jgi:flavin reductase (DIM6/NTAB) family NADH-FMN oxidoreductase RutF
MKYIDLNFNEYAEPMLQQLKKGAFMTTKVGNDVNTMTIAWGGINIVWNKNIFVAYVRYSRETYNFLNQVNEFTISVPLNRDLKKELMYCGTKSYRETDKINDCKLKLKDSRTIDTPIIQNCELHYECKVIYKQAMEPSSIPKDVLKKHYANNDFHVIFYGEITDSYILESE